MSKFIFNSFELEFNSDCFNDEPVFDPEPLDANFDHYCDNLFLSCQSISGEEHNDTSREIDVQKKVDNKIVEIDDDEDPRSYTRKGSRLIERFGRKPRDGYYLTQTKERIVYERHFNKTNLKPLKALKSFLGTGVEVEVRDSLIPGAGKGLFLTKTGTHEKFIPKGTMICLYDGVIVHTKEKITKYLEAQEGNDYLWQGFNSRNSHLLVDGQDPESSYGRFANEGFKDNNAEIIVANVSVICPRIILKSTRKIFLQHEIYVSYGAEYFQKDTQHTNPEFLAQAWEFYKIHETIPTIPQPVVQMDLVSQNSRKRTFEELRVLRLSKKRQALQLELEIIEIENEMRTFKK